MLARKLQKRQLEAEDGVGAVLKRDLPSPPRKLARRAALAASRPLSTELRLRDSALFHPARAIGVVSDGLAFAHASLGESDFITVSAGQGFQVFDCKNLRLAYIGPRLREKVRCLLCVGEVTLTALRTDIVAWHQLVELGRLRGHTSAVTTMCPVGEMLLVSGSEREVLVWQLSDIGLPQAGDGKQPRSSVTLAPLGSLSLGPSFGACTALCHPTTYLHKVLLGSDSGSLSLWNVRVRQRVHLFRAHEGEKRGCISCLCDVPNVLDLVAVGFASGHISILNTREDRLITTFLQAQGRVGALAFRSDADAPAQLVSGAPTGALVIWDLHKRRMHHIVEEAHRAPVTAAVFLPRQPLLVTSGRDNALRMWIFDTADGLPRLLRARSGCPGPVRCMRFYGSDDREVLAAGRCDRGGFLAKISFIQDHQNQEYSQSAVKKIPVNFAKHNLPPVVDLAACEVRHYDWPAVVTAHEQLDAAMVWSAFHQALAPKLMRPPAEADRAPVTAVAVSVCGNYCVIGLQNGTLHRFNLQSQLYRGPIPKAEEPRESAEAVIAALKPGAKKAAKRAGPRRAHKGRVCGLAITVGGLVMSIAAHPEDCTLRLWRLATHEAVDSVALSTGRPGSPSCLLLRPHGALIAVALDDGAVQVVDLHGGTVVRSFACGRPAVDMAFSAEGRWLAAALRGGGLRIFDLPAAQCVDSIVFARPAQSLCFAPSTAFLLIAHAKGTSIQVWANKFLFDPSLSAPLLAPEPQEPLRVENLEDLEDLDEEPANDIEGVLDEVDTDEEEEDEPEKADGGALAKQIDAVVNTKPLEPELLTLSDVPPAKWQAVLHLDLVKERNKAKEPPKPLPNAPFFLPTAHEGVVPRFVAPADEPDDEEAQRQDAARSRLLRGETALEAMMPLQALLRKGDFDGALTFLKAQTPSGVHLAIESMGPFAQGDLGELGAGLAFFRHHLGKAHFADELQVFLSLFLQAHGEELGADSALRAGCQELAALQQQLWAGLDTKCQKVRCFLGTLTQTQSQW